MSTPVFSTKSLANFESVYIISSVPPSLDVPVVPIVPSSPSTDTFNPFAISTISLDIATFSSYGKCEPSIITDVNPHLIALNICSLFSP